MHRWDPVPAVRAVPVRQTCERKGERLEARIARAFVASGVRRAEVLAGLVVAVARKYALPPELVASVVLVESHGDPMAVSPYRRCRARGLMQVRFSVWGKVLRDAGIVREHTDLHDPVMGLEAGAFVLRHYMAKANGNLDEALRLYSGGAPGYAEKVRRHLMEMGVSVWCRS